MNALTIIALIGLIAFFIERFVFSPFFSGQARRQFILENLRTRNFKELTTDYQGTYTFKGRKATAHWKVYPPNEDHSFYIIEFDVHPSTNPYGTISRSEFITIKDEKHLEEIRKILNETNRYDQFLTRDKEFDMVFKRI